MIDSFSKLDKNSKPIRTGSIKKVRKIENKKELDNVEIYSHLTSPLKKKEVALFNQGYSVFYIIFLQL